MMNLKLLSLSLLLGASFATPVLAEEGMFTPDQLQEISDELEQAGLEIAPEALADLTNFPMGAIVSLGGCSGSFVSPEGLIVTNHHCVRGSVQYNSTAETNYLVDGFLAASKGDELPAAPGSRIYVTTQVTDVTDRVRAGADDLTPTERFDLVEQISKDITAECEQDAGFRCQVASFFGGAQYKLIKRLEVRDVRLVYAPAIRSASMAVTSIIGSGRATPETLRSTALMSRPMDRLLTSINPMCLTNRITICKSVLRDLRRVIS